MRFRAYDKAGRLLGTVEAASPAALVEANARGALSCGRAARFETVGGAAAVRESSGGSYDVEIREQTTQARLREAASKPTARPGRGAVGLREAWARAYQAEGKSESEARRLAEIAAPEAPPSDLRGAFRARYLAEGKSVAQAEALAEVAVTGW